MPDRTPDEEIAALRAINAATLERLLAQRSAIESIETKGTLLLGFSLAALQLYLVQSDFHMYFRVLALASYGIAAAFGVIVIKPYEAVFPPEPMWFVAGFREEGEANVHRWLAAARVKAFETNVGVADRKKEFWWRTLVALGFAVVFSALSLLL